MVGLARAGLSPEAIASLSGRPSSNVRGRLAEARRLGIDVPLRQSTDAERLSDSARQIVEWRRAGVPNAVIAERLGLTVRNLEERIRRMRRAGVEIPRRGPSGVDLSSEQ